MSSPLTTRRRYSTDLTDYQWELIRPIIERERRMGCPTTVDLRDVVNALLYLNRTGCPWRLLPTDFPNWNTVRYYFDYWTLDGTLIHINDSLRARARQAKGRHPEPSAGIIDSQSVKTTEAGGERGFDGGKKGHRTQVTHLDRYRREFGGGDRARGEYPGPGWRGLGIGSSS